MDVPHETSPRERETMAGAGTAGGPSRSTAPRRPGIAGVTRAGGVARLILMAVACGGCAASNYDFDAVAALSGESRGVRLSEDLALEHGGTHGRQLYDISTVPLVATHLNVFAEADEEGFPTGFVETDIDACLPLFGFVDATVDRYDVDRRRYEHHEFSSLLWGLFLTHREQIATTAGLREQTRRQLLWLFDWDSSPQYVDSSAADLSGRAAMPDAAEVSTTH